MPTNKNYPVRVPEGLALGECTAFSRGAIPKIVWQKLGLDERTQARKPFLFILPDDALEPRFVIIRAADAVLPGYAEQTKEEGKE